MKAERWQEIERLYQAAREQEPDDRRAYLDEACAGDEELRREVESLLGYEEQARDFIESPALDLAARELAGEEGVSGFLLQARNVPLGERVEWLEGTCDSDAGVGEKVASPLTAENEAPTSDFVPQSEVDLAADATALSYPAGERFGEGAPPKSWLAFDWHLERDSDLKGIQASRPVEPDLPVLRRWGLTRLGCWVCNLAGTADTFRDVLVNSWRRPGPFLPREHKALQAYLRRAVKYRIRDEMRFVGRYPSAMYHTQAALGPFSLHLALDVAGAQKYVSVLARLLEEDRELLVARFELGYSFEQLALLSGRTPAAMRKALRQATIRLVEEMSGA